MLLTAGTALAERRVALVMAADDYRSLRPLHNAVNDGRAVEAALDKLGFEVFVETNRDLRRMRRALDDFRADAKGADVALVFFSGHGVEIQGENRLLPVDATFTSLDDFKSSSLPLEEVREAVASVAKIGLVILDACRNDPFGAETNGGRGATALAGSTALAIRPGLGRVGRAENILFAFSAAPGETASDGDGANSPFTAALTKYLGTDGLEIRSVLTLVQQEVYDLSRGRQLPYVESGLPDMFFAASASHELPERERLLLAMADVTPELRGMVETIAAESDMPLAPLYGALVDLDRHALPGSELELRLREAADAFVKVRDEMKTLASADPEVTRLRAEAEAQLSLGAVGNARQRLAQAAEIDSRSRQALQANFASRMLSEAATHMLSGGVARTDLDYALAIEDYRMAVALFEEAGDAARLEDHSGRRLLALSELGDLFATTGDIAAAAATYRQLVARAEERAVDYPQTYIRRDAAVSHGRLGDAMVTLGDLDGALAEYARTRAILGELTAKNPEPELLRDLAIVHDDIAEVYVRRGDLAAAEDSLRASLTLKQDLAGRNPDDPRGKRDLTVTLDALGEVRRAAGDSAAAQAAFQTSLEARLALAAIDPDNQGRQRDVSVSYDKIGDMQRDLGNPEAALLAYRASRDIVVALARRSPQDTQFQRDLSVSSNKIGNVLRDMEDLNGALASYREALAIVEKQARYDRNNSEWQRDWSVTIEKVADMLRRQGARDEALTLYEDSYGIMRRLLDKDPANTDWQRDISITLAEIGNLRVAARDFPGAYEALSQSLEMRRRLAEAGPDNALWQRDLVLAYADFAQVAEDPKAVLRQALELATELQRTGRLPPKQGNMADYLRRRLARLEAAGK